MSCSTRPGNREEKRTFFEVVDVVSDVMIERDRVGAPRVPLRVLHSIEATGSIVLGSVATGVSAGAAAADLTNPAVTVASLRLNAVGGVQGKVNDLGQLTSVGITCADQAGGGAEDLTYLCSTMTASDRPLTA